MVSTPADPESGAIRAPAGSLTRHFFLTLYDHLGRAVLINLIWVCASIPWLAAGAGCFGLAATAADAWGRPSVRLIGLSAGVILIAFSPASLFVVAVTASWGRGREESLRETWLLARGLALRAQAVGLGLGSLIAILLANALFYQNWGGFLGMALSGFMLWLVAGAALVSLYVYPLILAHPDRGLRDRVRHSVLLALDNLRFSAALLLSCTALAGIALVSGVGLALGAVPALALMLNLGLARVLERYGADPMERDTRRLRDLLRPWE